MGRDHVAGIPEEILQEILVRLPPKCVLRCRAVCPSWRSLASDPAFLLDHHRRQPELALIRSFRSADDVDDLFPSLESLHLRGAEFRPVFGFPEQLGSYFPVRASCDGLFIVGQCICNPSTRQWAPLSPNPKIRVSRLVGLYRHQPSGEYRVLYWAQLSPSAEHRVLLQTQWIVVFDTVAESFRHMRPPAVNPRHVMHLFDMGGTLAASTGKDSMTGMSIFILQDREHDVWAFHYRIKLPVMGFQEQGHLWAKVVSEEGDVLVSCYGHLLHYDKESNLVADFKYDDDLPVVLPYRLKESLIQHPFFKMVN